MGPVSRGNAESTTAGAGGGLVRRRSEHSHAAIVDATVELLREGGYSRLTIQAVAARARVGKATIYRWWPSKTGLVVEAIQSRLEPVSVELTGDLRVDLPAALHAALSNLTGSPLGQTLLAVAVEQPADPAARTQLQELIRRHEDAVNTVLRQAVARGDLRSQLDTDLVKDVFLGTLLYPVLTGQTSTESAAERLLDLVMSGASGPAESD